MSRRDEPSTTSERGPAGGSGADAVTRIRAGRPTLPPSLRRVADAVIADPAGSSELSIGALAERAATSPATVLRFCRTLGFGSYPQLRLALAAAVAHERAVGGEQSALGTDIDPSDSLEQIVKKIIYNEVRALDETSRSVDPSVLGRAVDAITGARRIDIFGVGASAFVGQDLHQKLHRIGHIAFVWTDVHAALTATALLGPGDVAIGISHSGETEDTVEPLTVAAARGATTVALTNFPQSPLAQAADLVLTTSARETPFRSGATVSRIAQLALVDCLFVAVAQRSYDAAAEALQETYTAVQRRRKRHP
ncbi:MULTISPECIES: MurR/RpiR family transcriptional regulator [Streptomyces]|jgi:DNA-binding MurR/RpiR family transcriptional regulator|uniref:MurR/RpiR family transcriptional regulator n=1 Tax=Streptomyces TaxID=1883 RepID=UPI0006E24844|nr:MULTISPECIES: MurR/RpiR family transcriptional regulator [unclassified Streptomyces]MBQ0997743.1 MurR/RpiR family transcriptional regulator [Streptomyces sp. RK62]